MSRWKFCSILVFALAFGALGCGGSASSGVAVVIAPPSASVITNTTQQFAATVTGSTNTIVTWTVTCPAGVTAPACGTIDANGLYKAPTTIPTVPASGGSTTPTPTPTATITVTAQADTTRTASATITIVTGIAITLTPASATVGTNEHFTIVATVSNPGCDTGTNPSCLNVTWTVPNTNGVPNAGVGTIDTNGVYTAPATAPSPNAVTITATSTVDTTITATATITVVTSSDPTLTSVSPANAALGSLFQDIYITGTNFISTNSVFVNGSLIDPSTVSDVSSSVIRARIPATLLSAPPPSGILQVTVSRQIGTPQNCTDVSQCQVLVKGVRPAIVGPSPDSILQGTAGVLSFNVNGGFFGTPSNPSVNATYDGQTRVAQVTTNTTRQLSVTIGGSSNPSDFGTPGLHQVTIRSNGDPTKFAAANLAVQPDPSISPITAITQQLTVGTAPSDVAINPATGMAVVANSGSNDITLIDLTTSPPSIIAASICTAAQGAVAPCPSSGPKSVAVDYVRNIALVVNATSQTIAVVDLASRTVTSVISQLQDPPVAVGINPVTGRALVSMNARDYGLIIDLTLAPPAVIGTVSISTGPNSHIAVEPHLNWAIATPGLEGSVGIVDLNRQTTNNITSVSRTAGAVTVTVQPATPAIPQSPLAVKVGDAIQIKNVSDNSFNGIYTVTSVGPGSSQFGYSQTNTPVPPDVTTLTTVGTVNYSEPVATLAVATSVQGIGINTETQQAVLVDPTAGGGVALFSLIDQSITPVGLQTNNAAEIGTIAGAYNPLTNIAVVVNPITNTLSVIDASGAKRLNSANLFHTRPDPVAVAVDPGSNVAVVANQSDNSVSIVSLGAIQSFSIAETSPKTFVANSTLSSIPTPSALTLTVIGKGLTCVGGSTNFTVRLDGIPLSTACSGNGNRVLTATVAPSLLMNARRFAVDVLSPGGAVSNVSDFTVQQSVDVSSCSQGPLPAAVSIDSQQNIAAVTLAGCNKLALINLSTGTGQTVAVGNNPLGVAVIPRLHLAVVANNVDGNASIVDELGATVTNTISTDSGSMGVAADQDTGEAAVANSVANTVSVVDVVTSGSTSNSTGSRPVAVAFNPQTHTVAVAETTANTVGFVATTTGASTGPFAVNLPTSVVYDPAPGDCASDLIGCFLATSSSNNVVEILDPTTNSQQTFRIGINPTAIAYNFLTSTLVSTNTASHTVTVVDFLDRRIRAVLTLPPQPANSGLAPTTSLQFALDVQPLTNIAVIADTANGRVLFVPLPR